MLSSFAMKRTLALGMSITVSAALVVACYTGGSVAPSDPSEATPEAGAAQPQAGVGLPCDVDAVLAKNCRQCHSAPPRYGAPMPLVSYADLHAASLEPGKQVYEACGARIHDDKTPMPQPPNARLDAADTATLDTWIAAGAPTSTASCGGDGGAAAGQPLPLDCSPDQRIRPTSKWNVTPDTDLYVCYGFDTTASQKRHVIAGAARIDNTKVVHHVLLYQSDTAVSGTPAPCGAGGGKGWRLVTGWAPGGKNFELPPQAGFAEESGTTHWAMQIHYNNAQALTGQTDETGFDLCSTDQLRPNDADILATGTLQIAIPPRSTYETTCDTTIPATYGNINVISSWAHMHRLGRAENATRLRAGAPDATLLDAPSYDFSTGAGANAVDVDVKAGDTLRTTCRWQNPGDTTVSFGEATADEMCFAFLTYYPKITAPRFVWEAPALVSKCTAQTVPPSSP